MKKLIYLTFIALSFIKLNAQTTFTANILRGDTVKSTVMIKANDIAAMGITASDTVRAHEQVVAEKNLEVQGNLSLNGRFDLSNGLAFKTFPASAGHPAIMKFGSTGIIGTGPGVNPGPGLDPNDVPSCAAPFFGVNPAFVFGGYLRVINGVSGGAVLGHDGANAILDVDGSSTAAIPGSLLINYYCHRNVNICTGTSINPTENKVFIGDFLNARKHIEIGNPVLPINDATNIALEINTVAGKGIRFNTNNNGLPLISVANTNFAYSPINIFGAGNIEINTNSTGTIGKMFVVKDPTASVSVQEKFVVFGDGKTYIGSGRPKAGLTTSNAMLSVDGGILCKDVFVAISNTYWADYVFNKDYKLMPLNEVKNFIQKNKHLPNISSGKDIEEKGLALAEMQKKQMEKIEELYLYIIKLNEDLDLLKKQNNDLLKKLQK